MEATVVVVIIVVYVVNVVVVLNVATDYIVLVVVDKSPYKRPLEAIIKFLSLVGWGGI